MLEAFLFRFFEVVDFLMRSMLFDLWVFSQWWLYAPLCIPFLAYLLFFVAKWWLLTMPFWLPVRCALGARNVVKVTADG